MKSIMLSIQPYYVFLIIARLMGWNIPQHKIVEVRKDFPKDLAWNKVVHIYCSKSKKSFKRIPKQYQPLMAKFLGKVIGEFVCDKIDNILYDDRECTNPPLEEVLEKSCLSYKVLCEYGNYKDLYGWHISDLKIYDKPKELGEFFTVCHKLDCDQCGACPHLYVARCSYPCDDDIDTWCGVDNCKPLNRPPQSWCYCEELQ